MSVIKIVRSAILRRKSCSEAVGIVLRARYVKPSRYAIHRRLPYFTLYLTS